jgi:transposase
MVPTLAAPPGVKGHRPVVGTWDCKHLLYVFAVVNLVTAAVHANTLESPKGAKQKTGQSKTRRMQEAFAAHRRHIARMGPAVRHKRVVVLIDHAPWHRGKPINEALRESLRPEFQRLPGYSPRLNPIERFWKLLRRRATHNRLFDTLADLRRSIRSSLCYDQTMRDRVRALLDRRSKKRTASSGS